MFQQESVLINVCKVLQSLGVYSSSLDPGVFIIFLILLLLLQLDGPGLSLAPHLLQPPVRFNLRLSKQVKLDLDREVFIINIISRRFHALLVQIILESLGVNIDDLLIILVDLCSVPQHELHHLLVGIVLSIVKSRVATGVDPVDDGLHGSLDIGAVITQQSVDGLFVVPPRGLAVHHNLVVVPSLEHHVEDGLTELVLDQEVGVREPLEDLDNKMITSGGCKEHWRSGS